jgi:VWFA-related protein
MIAPRSKQLSIAAVIIVVLSWVAAARPRLALAQSPPSGTQPAPKPPDSPAPSETPELDTHEGPMPLRTSVELVPVRVVVRDRNGKAVANLEKDDFQLLEDGKPQVITNFVVETLASSSTSNRTAPAEGKGEAESQPAGFERPNRFVALLFDDVHLDTAALLDVRRAALKYVDVAVAPTDRTALYTVSGLGQLDFTDDLVKLRQALANLQSRSLLADARASNECPPMDELEADKIQNQNDEQAMEVAMTDFMHCDFGMIRDSQANGGQLSPADMDRARATIQASALRVDEQDSVQAQSVFRALVALVRRLSAMPGQRTLVLISPGFIYSDDRAEFSEVVDQAIRSSVFVNTLDARGLYTPNLGGDIAQSTNEPDPRYAGIRASWRIATQSIQTELLTYLADDTGGYAFGSRNDLDVGLRQVAGAPEVYYYLAFSPHNLKFDGKFHSLKVTLRTKENFTIAARRGYYAPRSGTPVDTAKQDIEDAVFSQEEQHGLPVALETQFYKTDSSDAKLSVLAHVDLAHLRFEKADGRNQNDLTVVAALFDRNGNFIAGTQRVVTMKLRDETLARLSRTGVTVRTNFDVKPGDYVVRLVVRDSKAAQLSATNGVVEIPY